MKIRRWEPERRGKLGGWLRYIRDTHRPKTPADLLAIADREAATEVHTGGEHAELGELMLEAADDWDGLMTAARSLIVVPQRLRVIIRLRFCGPGGPPNYIVVEPGEVVEAVHLSELDAEHRQALNRAQKRAGSDLLVPFRRGGFVHWGILGQDLEAL